MTIEYVAELRRHYRARQRAERAADRTAAPAALPGLDAMPGRIERVRRAAMIRALDAELARRNTAVVPLFGRRQIGSAPLPETGATAVVVPFPARRQR